jgi:flavin reductase (DIM6/NTAB) family NADH-FMN oxidoreductase RutF
MSTKAINEALGKLSSGVYVVTSKYENTLNGCTVVWAAQLSFTPLLITVAIAKVRYTHELIAKSKTFALNILGQNQLQIAKHFGFQSGRKVDKFANIGYELKTTGAPVLRDAIAYLDCNLWASYEGGDHTIFVGEVVDGNISSEIDQLDPLVFKQEDFAGG